MVNGLLFDGVVEGSISGGDTSATVTAEVSCVNSVPTGSISGTVETFTGTGTSEFTFSSNQPLIVATLKTSTLQSVGAFFTDVTVRNVTTNTTTTGCSAELTATRLSSELWIGSFTVFCPTGPNLFIFGTFSGDVVVNRQVFCKPLL